MDDFNPNVFHDNKIKIENDKNPIKTNKSSSNQLEDPLDVFMQGIELQVAKQALDHEDELPINKRPKSIRVDLEDADYPDDYQMIQDIQNDSNESSKETFVDYDEFGRVKMVKNRIEPLPSVDHSKIRYEDFERNFYEVCKELKDLKSDDIISLREEIGINVFNESIKIAPCTEFDQLNFDEKTMEKIKNLGFKCPTPIQAQALPIILSGFNINGVAETGSGKTAAYVWPMIVHIKNSKLKSMKSTPRALILSPTRELSLQINNSIKKLSNDSLNTFCALGGSSLWHQQQSSNVKIDVVIATPGRLIDLVKKNTLSLGGITYFVLDEADKMLNMGFEYQVRSISKAIRPDRQTIFFSATTNNRIQRFSKDIMPKNALKIVQGDLGHINHNVFQKLVYTPNINNKLSWLCVNLAKFSSQGLFVLIFVNQKAHAESVNNHLHNNHLNSDVIHGDLGQYSRSSVINNFRKKKISILVATDIASRGLDIPHVNVVINFDLPAKFDTLVHRLGRTGRAGQKGEGFCLISPKDSPEIVSKIIKNIQENQNNYNETLQSSNLSIPQEIISIASKYTSKIHKNKSSSQNPQHGLGYDASAGSKSFDTTPQIHDTTSSRAKILKNNLLTSFKSNFVHADKSLQMEISNPNKSKSRWDS